jgi:hypothetical protein
LGIVSTLLLGLKRRVSHCIWCGLFSEPQADLVVL